MSTKRQPSVKTSIKQHLKGCRIAMSVQQEREYAHANLRFKFDDGMRSFDVRAQANRPGNSFQDKPEQVQVLSRERHSALIHLDCGHFYAVTAQVEVPMCSWGGSTATEGIALRELTDQVIADKNLRHVYPECDLSRFIAALECLGAYVVLDYVDGVAGDIWHEQRREREREKREREHRNTV